MDNEKFNKEFNEFFSGHKDSAFFRKEHFKKMDEDTLMFITKTLKTLKNTMFSIAEKSLDKDKLESISSEYDEAIEENINDFLLEYENSPAYPYFPNTVKMTYEKQKEFFLQIRHT